MKTLTFDEILEQVGDFGPYQKMAYYFLCTPAIMKAAIVLSAVFVLQLPQFRCAVPGLSNDTFQEQDDHHKHLIDINIPPASADEEFAQFYSQCHLYANSTSVSLKLDNSTAEQDTLNTTDQLSACHSWVYDKSEVLSSILTEFNYVCDNKAMRSHTNMGFFTGSLVGCVLIGAIADIIGRKKALLVCVGIQVVCGSSLYFIPSMVGVVVVRSFQGMAAEMFAISAATGMELVGPRKRTFAGIVVQLFWSLGGLLVLLVSYLTKDWRISELVYGLVAVPIFIMACIAPESPRWLLDKRRYQEAEKIMKRIAKSNKTTLPDMALKPNHDEPTTPKVKVWRLLTNKHLVATTLVVFFNWFAVNFLYNGLSLNLGNLSGSLYLNFLISIPVEAAGFLMCLPLLDRTGRKPLYIAFMFVGGVACLAVNFPVVFGNADHEWIITTLVMLGKMTSSSCYTILYIVSVEVFPTVVRNSAIGLCSVFENVSGMVAPYVADLGILVGGSLSKALPTTVFGCVALLAALLSLLLPETLHRAMPDTIEDVVRLVTEKRPDKRSGVVDDVQMQHLDVRL
ncbi:hypothetical protein BsWGS_12604 [Bradybaena similaris]